MKIGILSQDIKLYSTKRLYETAIKRGHDTEVVSYLRCYMNIAKAKPRIFFVIPSIRISVFIYGLLSTSPLELFILLNPANGAEVFLTVLFLFITLNFTYFTLFLVTTLISAASIEARFAPVSIFAITFFTLRSGKAAFSFHPTTLFSRFFFGHL